MKRPAPGASRRAVGTAPRQRERIPPVAYRVRRAVKVEGFAVREEDELGRERVDCSRGRRESADASERRSRPERIAARTSEMVLSRVNGVRTKPTAVRAVLPTRRSPTGVSLALVPGAGKGAPFGRNRVVLPMKVRNRDSERK